MPDLPKAHYSVWVRGYGLVDSPKVQTAPGKLLNLTAVRRRMRRQRRSTIRRSTGMRCSRSRPRASSPALGRKATACPGPEESGGLAGQREEPRLHVVSCAGHHRDAHHSEGTGNSRIRLRWQRRIQAGQAMTQMMNVVGRLGAERARFVGRLDRSHRRRRTAVREAGAATGYGAQRRSHPVGLEPPHGLPARFDRDRPAQAYALPQWQALRIAGRKHGLRADPRSRDAYGD